MEGGWRGGGGVEGVCRVSVPAFPSFFAVPSVPAFPVRLWFLAGTIRGSVPDLPVNPAGFSWYFKDVWV